MKVLVVGGGGREHAICWKLSQSPRLVEGDILCAPGNGGIAEVATCFDVAAEDIEGQVNLAKEQGVDLAIIGPEVPLAMGIVDAFTEEGIKAFGPDANCAQLEASKAFTNAFLDRHNIPTSKYKEYTDKESIIKDIGIYGYPMVIKADGLAAGKGVILAEDAEEARQAVEEMMGDKVFGSAGDKVVVEECLFGVEASSLCFVDKNTIVPMEYAQDYKRIGDGDEGPNTGGMGTYSPSLVIDEKLDKRIREEILLPTLKGFQEDGLKFRGVLFVGLMLTEDGPKVIEFNNRFGDPEAQSVLMRMDSDLLDVIEAVCDDRLADVDIKWSEDPAVCVVMASGGYPGSYEKGKVISGLDDVDEDVVVFHAGTKISGDNIVTSGGRVLGVTAKGRTHEEARAKAYANVEKISFGGANYRKDIGTIVNK